MPQDCHGRILAAPTARSHWSSDDVRKPASRARARRRPIGYLNALEGGSSERAFGDVASRLRCRRTAAASRSGAGIAQATGPSCRLSTGIARLFRLHDLHDVIVAVLVRLVQDFDLITFLELVELDARRLQTMGLDVVADADRAAKGIAKQLAASSPAGLDGLSRPKPCRDRSPGWPEAIDPRRRPISSSAGSASNVISFS